MGNHNDWEDEEDDLDEDEQDEVEEDTPDPYNIEENHEDSYSGRNERLAPGHRTQSELSAYEAEDLTIDTPPEVGFAVELNPWMFDNLKKLKGVKAGSSLLRSFLESTDRRKAFGQQIRAFVDELLEAMYALPASPGHRKITDEEHAALQTKFIRVYKSYGVAKELLWVWTEILIHEGKKDKTWSKMLNHISAYEPYAKYEALRAWLYRRTDRYKKWSTEYRQRPEVKKRLAEYRTKEEDAERKRQAYWARKGLQAPPKRTRASVDRAIVETEKLEEKPSSE